MECYSFIIHYQLTIYKCQLTSLLQPTILTRCFPVTHNSQVVRHPFTSVVDQAEGFPLGNSLSSREKTAKQEPLGS